MACPSQLLWWESKVSSTLLVEVGELWLLLEEAGELWSLLEEGLLMWMMLWAVLGVGARGKSQHRGTGARSHRSHNLTEFRSDPGGSRRCRSV